MFTKHLKPLAVAVFAATLLLPQVALAAPDVSTAPAIPAPVVGEWTEIQSGGNHWYSFKYDFDTLNRPAEILMFTEPNESVTLKLLNGDQARAWQQVGGDRESFGAATTVHGNVIDTSRHTANDSETEQDNDSDAQSHRMIDEMGTYASWSAVLESSGTYYILIHRDTHATGPANYRFTVNGDGVTLQPTVN